MEENKELPLRPVTEAEEATAAEPITEPASVECVTEPFLAEAESAPIAPAGVQGERDEVAEPQALPSVTEISAPITDWGFGGTSAKKTGGMRAFFAVFGGVFGICVLLLIATLFLGGDGFQIIKTLHSERVIYVREDDGTSGLLTPNEAADVIKKSTVTVAVRTPNGNGVGSGFVYDNNGHICTNYHVIDGAVEDGIQVILPNGTTVNATVVGYDEIADLAVLKVEADGLVPVTLGSSADLLVGDAVVAVGTPANIDFAGTATFGNVSATKRLLALTKEDGSVYRKITVIQTDTSVNPGNSGGPMADMYGHVIGIVVRKIINYGGTSYEGIGFAIPIDGAKEILDAIIKTGSFTGHNPVAEGRSLLGVTGHGGVKDMWYRANADGSITTSETEQPGYYQMPEDGVYVMSADGNNVQGKLQAGDVILAINGLRMTTIQDVIAEVNRHYVGETVRITALRDGTQIEVNVILVEGEIA